MLDSRLLGNDQNSVLLLISKVVTDKAMWPSLMTGTQTDIGGRVFLVISLTVFMQ